ncbi:MAG: endonuclease MutS2 [Oscillospiraceae bacterium]|nr:endonuclease MutS2 [Oscillospiraceae bacterium]
MMQFYEKSSSILELPQVLALLAQAAVSSEAKEQALALTPSDSPVEVTRRLQETSAARRMTDLKGAPSFREVRPIAAAVQRAERDGTLSTRELLDVAAVLRASRVVKDYGSQDREEKTCIDYLFQSLHTNRFLEDKIFTAIISEEEIADSASTELAAIRRQMRLATSKIRESLQKIISSSYYDKYLQEPIITMRSNRYVVPVKSECRNGIPGLLHDVSASGATLFIEPMTVVQANNELRELGAKEKQEIERILMELSVGIAAHSNDILSDYTLLVTLDGIFARARLSYQLNAMEPKLSTDGSILLNGARHPLLDPKIAVPIDVRLGSDFDTLVITGPNTGGKTVSLKTIGLLTLMAQCGLHIPVNDGSQITVFSKVLADIGDEQSIEQSLSTFSSHMTNIVHILEEADENTLILFDELGAGTDPVEGAALAISIIGNARKKGACIAATTHYAELKIFAITTPGVQNASCEFDVETLQPTYRLLIGVPGKSNAFAISRRLGLSEEIIEEAKKQINSESLQFEDVLSQLEQQRHAMEQEKLETRKLRLKMEQDAKTAEEYRIQMEQLREKASIRARADAQALLDDARETANQVFQELDTMRRQARKQESAQAANEMRTEIRRRLNQAEDQLGPRRDFVPPPQADDAPLTPGDTVELLSTRTKATVLSVRKDGTLTLQAGILNITAKRSEVRKTKDVKPAPQKTVTRSSNGLRTAAAPRELDLRGMTVEESLAVLEQFLDNALLSKVETVTVIHGKGTGALRSAVHQMLKTSRYVKSFRLGRYGEGEAGVTVVTLR